MKLLWKGAASALIAATAMFVAAAPAQAQYYGNGYDDGYGRSDRNWREDRRRDRWDRERRDWRGSAWTRDRYWRDDRRGWRHNSRYRERCWTERRYSHYYGRRIKVRVCR